MRLFLSTGLLLFGSLIWAQQLVIPKELNERQAKQFKRISESVSAPCCSNAIPVAYHESGMAIYVRDVVKERLLAGDSEDQIMAMLGEMKLGSEQVPLIFAIPDKNPLGLLTWWFPALVILAGIAFIVFLFRQSKKRKSRPTNDVLIETYRSHIQTKVAARQS